MAGFRAHCYYVTAYHFPTLSQKIAVECIIVVFESDLLPPATTLRDIMRPTSP